MELMEKTQVERSRCQTVIVGSSTSCCLLVVIHRLPDYERRKYGMLGLIEVEGENTMSIRDWEVIIRFLGEASHNPL